MVIRRLYYWERHKTGGLGWLGKTDQGPMMPTHTAQTRHTICEQAIHC